MKRLLSFVFSALVVFSLAGCGGQESYKVLSFFFDGVPKPVEKKAVTPGEEKGGETPAGAPVRGGSVHGPYAAKMCNGCHDPVSHALLLPERELCFKCHAFKMNKKYIHGPFASGECLACHNPHSSPNRFLLVTGPKDFCLSCHDMKEIAKNAAHKDIKVPCISCHDGHMSDKRYLLK